MMSKAVRTISPAPCVYEVAEALVTDATGMSLGAVAQERVFNARSLPAACPN